MCGMSRRGGKVDDDAIEGSEFTVSVIVPAVNVTIASTNQGIWLVQLLESMPVSSEPPDDEDDVRSSKKTFPVKAPPQDKE
jgi:hypothetical protein